MQNKILCLTTVDSTQTYLKDNLASLELYDCVYAKTQTNGYGRSGNWDSSFENLYFSKIMPVDELNHLTIICAIHMLISKYLPEVEIQVPNDLYYNQQKMGGFIIENTDRFAIVGIGININCSKPEFVALADVTNTRYEIEDIAIELDELINLNSTMSKQMLEEYYQQNCKIIGRYVEYIELQSGDCFNGIVTALDSESITIDNLKFNQMAIKITNKKGN